MIELWFGLLCFMLITFTVLDGWNFGAGVLHLIVAKTTDERRHVVAALGPAWSWHEVWLVAAGGVFLLAFPKVMAAAFSGFYLALWLVLWAFIGRGMSIEVGGHVDDELWQTGWDVAFAASSLLLAVLFGVALGNVIRGVPLDQAGRFSMSLFTNFSVHGRVGILDWYTLSVGVFAVALLTAHGAAYLTTTAEGPVHERSVGWMRRLWIAVLALFPVVTLETWFVRPEMFSAMMRRPVAWLAVAGLGIGAWMVWTGIRRRRGGWTLAGSSAVIAGLLAAAAAAVFPVMLRSTMSGPSLTVHDGATEEGLRLALLWWPIAMLLAAGYFVVIVRRFSGTTV
jgi:cytochrome bd ubiquinol oxidase subunit II